MNSGSCCVSDSQSSWWASFIPPTHLQRALLESPGLFLVNEDLEEPEEGT